MNVVVQGRSFELDGVNYEPVLTGLLENLGLQKRRMNKTSQSDQEIKSP